MAGFTVARNVEQRVAVMIAPAVERIAEEVATEGKRLAPAVKTWVSQRDGDVRDQHVEADGQTVPVNVRFALTSYQWDIDNRGVGPKTYLLFPRDPSGLAHVAIVNCRCFTELNYEQIRAGIRVEQAVVTGKRVTATAVSEGEGVLEAEMGDAYDVLDESVGERYMGRAASTVARSRRAASGSRIT